MQLDQRSSRVDVKLKVTNIGTKPTELAPWGPTVMAPGGVEIIPLPPKKGHPAPPEEREVAGRLRAEPGTDPLAVLRLRGHALDFREEATFSSART